MTLERLQLFQRIFPTFEKSNALIKLRHQVWLHSLLKKMEWCLNARLCYLCRISHNIHMNKGLTPNLCICAADLHSCNQTKFSEALFWHFKHLQHKPRFDRNIKFHSGTSCTVHIAPYMMVVVHLADESSKKRIVFSSIWSILSLDSLYLGIMWGL